VTRNRGTGLTIREHADSPAAGSSVFKKLRIAFLLYILVFVAVGQLLDTWRSRDWDNSLWINLYAVNASGSESVARYIDSLQPDAFETVERFFDAQADGFGLALERPFRIRVARPLDRDLPALPQDAGMFSVIVWSLRMRWFVMRLDFSGDLPSPDITLFAIYHDADSDVTLDRSTALRKGMIAVANLFGSPAAHSTNQMIIAHELLHTLGASDKYDPATGLPVFPRGFADPDQEPLYPQARAELMAGRVPMSKHAAEIPPSLGQVVIGPETAFEIGWSSSLESVD
jgi:hypothetical protein